MKRRKSQIVVVTKYRSLKWPMARKVYVAVGATVVLVVCSLGHT